MRSIATIFAFLIALAPGLVHAQDVVVVDTADDHETGNCSIQNDPGPDASGQDGGNCTLRAAIETANGAANVDQIRFDLPSAEAEGQVDGVDWWAIQVERELDAIENDNLLVDGKTQDGYQQEIAEDEEDSSITPLFTPVMLDGQFCEQDLGDELLQDGRCRGFGVQAENVRIQGLAVGNFLNQAIRYGSDSVDGRVRNNFLGTLPDGETAAPNGRAEDGEFGARAAVHVRGQGTIITENVISGNNWAGVRVGGPLVGPEFEDLFDPGVGEDLTIQENWIGVTTIGDPLGNGANGVAIRDGATNNLVFDNIISHNARNGVRIVDGFNQATGDTEEGSTINNRISQNEIYANVGLAIDLQSNGWGDPRDNDSGDMDDGPNQGQNFPEIISAQYCPTDEEARDPDWNCPDPDGVDEGFIEVTYRVDSDPNGPTSYPLEIEFFRADDSDPAQARRVLGTDTYTRENFNRNQRFRIYSPDASVTRADSMTATATDANGNTSELTRPAEVLPVEFADTPSATHNDGAVVLSWTTLSETNNAGFQVQQRVDGSFQDVEGAFIEGQGTTTSLQNYEYTLEGLSAGTHTLRLEQQDFDGTTGYSAEFSVTVPAQLELTEAAPNPFSDQTSVTLTVDQSQQVTAEVYDVLGRRVTTLHDGQVTPEQPLELTFDGNGLSSGLYLIRVEGETFSEVRRATLVR